MWCKEESLRRKKEHQDDNPVGPEIAQSQIFTVLQQEYEIVRVLTGTAMGIFSSGAVTAAQEEAKSLKLCSANRTSHLADLEEICRNSMMTRLENKKNGAEVLETLSP